MGDETRFKILKFLLKKSLCVNVIADKLDISQSAVSQHLRVLREAGLAKSKKEGYFVHYSIDLQGLKKFKSEADEILKPHSFSKNCRSDDECIRGE